jgi:hypothetical protein
LPPNRLTKSGDVAISPLFASQIRAYPSSLAVIK